MAASNVGLRLCFTVFRCSWPWPTQRWPMAGMPYPTVGLIKEIFQQAQMVICDRVRTNPPRRRSENWFSCVTCWSDGGDSRFRSRGSQLSWKLIRCGVVSSCVARCGFRAFRWSIFNLRCFCLIRPVVSSRWGSIGGPRATNSPPPNENEAESTRSVEIIFATTRVYVRALVDAGHSST